MIEPRGEKSPKQRIAEAADALRKHGAHQLRLSHERMAEIVLETDDPEPPEWPTNERAMKSQEQRIKDATVVAEQLLADVRPPRVKASYLAERILEAADREPPKWPTDESVEAFESAEPHPDPSKPTEDIREALHEAFLADPIIKAAIAYRDSVRDSGGDGMLRREVIDAVNEAGL